MASKENRHGTLQFIPLERRSDDRSWTMHRIVRGRPRVMNSQLPLATSAPLADSWGGGGGWQKHPQLHYWAALEENTRLTTCPRVFSSKRSMTRSPWHRKWKIAKENPLILYNSSFLFIFVQIFTTTKRHDMTGHAQPYPGARGLRGLQSIGRYSVTAQPNREQHSFISFLPKVRVRCTIKSFLDCIQHSFIWVPWLTKRWWQSRKTKEAPKLLPLFFPGAVGRAASNQQRDMFAHETNKT
jgi:hypothetical protein